MAKNNRIPRKLKKAIKKMVFYYDGCHLCWDYKQHRETRHMHKAFDIYLNVEEGQPSRRGKLIDNVIHGIYLRTCCQPYWKPTPKWYKKEGLIFVYYRDGHNFPGGKWIPKKRPDDTYHRSVKMKPKGYYVQRETYDYFNGYQVVEEYEITEDEYISDVKTKELFLIYREKECFNQ